jgi:endogenous inhibitor of DNA gyrase (YacG/DUF329 family)
VTCTAQTTGARRGVLPGSAPEALKHLLSSMDAARGPLEELRAALGGDGYGAQLVVGTTAALCVCESAVAFLDLAAAAQRGATARYRVTCPECGAESTAEWTDDLPPGGVSPVECPACGYVILSESEGDPVPVSRGGA